MADILEELLAGNLDEDKYSAGSSSSTTLEKTLSGNLDENKYDIDPANDVVTPSSVEGSFMRGVQAGVEGMNADTDFFQAMVQNALGLDDAADANITNARNAQERSGTATQGMESLEGFMDAPSFSGGVQLVSKTLGQVSPYLVSTVTSGGYGAVAAGLTKIGLNSAARASAKRVIRDSINREAKGAATPDEKDIAELAFQLAKQSRMGKVSDSLSLTKGRYAGQFADEYKNMAGMNFGENLEIDGMSRDEAGARAGLLAIPQAVIGVGGEIGVEKLLINKIKNVAKKRAGKNETSSFGRLAKGIAKTGAKSSAIEGTTEVLQEGLQGGQRVLIDDQYTMEDLQMRLGEAAFGGVIAGGAMGGGGATVAASLGATANVMDKANKYIQDARDQRVNSQIDEEQFGPNNLSYNSTAPEPQADIDAQVRAMNDPDTARESVWIAGSEPAYDVPANSTKPTYIEQIDAYVRFIPGRGTIISKNKDIADKVVEQEASDSVLQEVLGYSQNKVAGADVVIQVVENNPNKPDSTDEGANVVWEQATTEENSRDAYDAASQQVGKSKSYKIRRRTVEQIRENRNQKLQDERGETKERNIESEELVRLKEQLGVKTESEQDGTTKDEIAELEEALKAQGVTVKADLAEIKRKEDAGEITAGEAKKQRAVANKKAQELIETNKRLKQYKKDYDVQEEQGLDQEDFNDEGGFGLTEEESFQNVVPETKDGKPVLDDQGNAVPKKFPARIKDRVYKDTQAIRDNFKKVFSDKLGTIDFESGVYSRMSDTVLKRATKLQEQNPEAPIRIVENADGTFGIEQAVLPDQLAGSPIVERQGKAESRGKPVGYISQFVREAIKAAKDSVYARFKETKAGRVQKKPSELFTLTAKGGKPVAVNLPDLIRAGQRILVAEDKRKFEEGGKVTAQREGLFRILTELLDRGYEIKVGSLSITADTLGIFGDQKTLFDQVAKDRRAYNKAYKESIENGTLEPKRSDLLELMEVEVAAFDGGNKNVPLSKLILVTPPDTTPSTPKFTVAINRDADKGPGGIFRDVLVGPMFFEGTKSEVAAFIEEESSKNPEYTFNVQNESGTTLVDGDAATVLDTKDESNKFMQSINEDNVFLDIDNDQDFADQGSETDNMSDPDQRFDTPEDGVFGLGVTYAGPVRSNLSVNPRSLAGKIFNLAKNKLKLKNPVSVFTVEGLLNATPEFLQETFKDPNVAKHLVDRAKALSENDKGGATYIGFDNAHLIIVDTSKSKNDLQTALALGHELGHALFNEQIKNGFDSPTLNTRLFKEYQNAAKAEGAPESYQGPRGFEEWYADQVSIWARKQYIKDYKRKASKGTITFSPEDVTNGLDGQRPKKAVSKGLTKAHFEKIVSKLKGLFDSLSSEFQRRFGPEAYNETFNEYVENVLKVTPATAQQASAAQTASFKSKKLAGAIEEATRKAQKPGVMNALDRQAKKIIRSKKLDPIFNFLATADSRLRKIGGDKLADLFYGRAQDSGSKLANRLGFVKAVDIESNKLWNKLEKDIGDINSEEVIDAFDEAFTDKKTSDLSPLAQKVRKFFENIHDDYIGPSNTPIKKRVDYTPVVLNMMEINNNPKALVELIVKKEGEASRAGAEKAVDKLVKYQQAVIDGEPVKVKKPDPAKKVEQARKLTANLDPKDLREAGLTLEPTAATAQYIRHVVKRVEWNKHTKDSAGNSILEEELGKLNKRQREEAEMIINTYLGYNFKPLGPVWKNINSALSFIQIVGILPLAVAGSIPELAGPVIASKEFSSIGTAFREIVNTVKNRDEARNLARDLGIVTNQSAANTLMSQSELEWMNAGTRKATDAFFRIILLDTYTKFTREFAVNMGIKFIEQHSTPETMKPESARYLKELGVKPEQFKAWQDSGMDFSTPEGKAIEQGLQRFVESATLRPNSAERPVWASDPRWALAWQLKGFFYSYGKVLFSGTKREATTRAKEAGLGTADAKPLALMGAAASSFALMGIATMPLAMVGMELREYAKYGLAFALPGFSPDDKDYFRTDSMSVPEYFKAAFSRSFAYGPVTVASQMSQANDWGEGPLGVVAAGVGPTAETVNRIFTDGFDKTLKNRILPTGLLQE